MEAVTSNNELSAQSNADTPDETRSALKRYAPFDLIPGDIFDVRMRSIERVTFYAGDVIFREGEKLDFLYLIERGTIDAESSSKDVVSRRGPGDILGERSFLSDGSARLTIRAIEESQLIKIPAAEFEGLLKDVPDFAAWFNRLTTRIAATETDSSDDLATVSVADLMHVGSVVCDCSATVSDAAQKMRDSDTRSIVVLDDGKPVGIVTTTDLTNKVLANNLGGDVAVRDVMTPDPVTIAADALGIDALSALSENNIRQIPVVRDGQVVGVLESSRLLDRKAETASSMILEILNADTADSMAKVTARVPSLLAQLVGSGAHPTRIGRRITDVTDAVTRRLLAMGEETLGPPPVPYLWLACGSQGRREQTSTSDQDNCLILDDRLTTDDEPYFERLAEIVTDGLNACGYVYCPGDMMARNPMWRQRRQTWQGYFTKWIDTPDNMAQMLASVMFDLRPIHGEASLFDDLQEEVLDKARANSIFVAHMVANSLKHEPPLSIFRGLALIRSGEHKNTIDLKLSGVVPVTDLARIYALQGGISDVSTMARLEHARDLGVISASGARDLIDAYNLIAHTRLKHQAEQARMDMSTDNFVSPRQLSELERNHLRDAFGVIKTMQSALRHGRASLV